MVACPILVCWHRGQCYCRDEVSGGVASMLPVFDMVARWELLSMGGLERKVSLCYRGLLRLRYDQVGVVPVKGVT